MIFNDSQPLRFIKLQIAEEIMKVLTFWVGLSAPGGEHVTQKIWVCMGTFMY